MIKIDWFYLKRPLIIFVVSTLIAVALVVAGYQYEQARNDDYQRSASTLRSTYQSYSKMVHDIDLMDQYRSLYSRYKASGLVGDERRLSWIESLESTNQVLKLPILTYDLQPREGFKRPGLRVAHDIVVGSAPMSLSMGLLHEEDLFALLEGLHLSIKNFFTVDSCSLTRLGSVNRQLARKKENIRADCSIRWVTIDVK